MFPLVWLVRTPWLPWTLERKPPHMRGAAAFSGNDDREVVAPVVVDVHKA